MAPIALVTGATAGIGQATAKILAQHGYQLVLTGRRQDRLQELQEKLRTDFETASQILVFDVREASETQRGLESLPDTWKQVDVLVNNAGLAAGLASISNGNLDHWDRMIDTNVKGLLYVSRVVIPWMVERKSGHVVNIGSIAGKEVYPNGNVYCASKHAVDALSRGMRLDLVHDGVKVTNIAPGLVETEFSLVRFDGDADRARQVYQGLEPLTAEDVADCVWFAVSRPAHVTIGDLLVLPAAQANSTTVNRQQA
ncbi:MAG: SDR family NAD(P)-dependent oxidoreductase [Leptolyngbya sp. SIO3F4]|nr:SDR family NAD(P)-dependent oxidoreductase [Leptolyngbya sp. SIO3F4]